MISCLWCLCSLLPLFLPSGQQRASRLLPQWVLYFSVLHAGGRPAPGPTPFLRHPAASPVVMASGGKVADARRGDHGQADLPAVLGPSQDRHHAGGSWMVSEVKSRKSPQIVEVWRAQWSSPQGVRGHLWKQKLMCEKLREERLSCFQIWQLWKLLRTFLEVFLSHMMIERIRCIHSVSVALKSSDVYCCVLTLVHSDLLRMLGGSLQYSEFSPCLKEEYWVLGSSQCVIWSLFSEWKLCRLLVFFRFSNSRHCQRPRLCFESCDTAGEVSLVIWGFHIFFSLTMFSRSVFSLSECDLWHSSAVSWQASSLMKQESASEELVHSSELISNVLFFTRALKWVSGRSKVIAATPGIEPPTLRVQVQ